MKLGILAAACVLALAAQQTSSTTSAQQPPAPTLTPEQIAAYTAALPDAPGRDVVVKVCGVCHEPQRAGSLRLTREGWQATVDKMMGLGAQATPADQATIVEYLSTQFKGEAPKPINMNSAPAIELEAVAGLLRKEAAAWIEYRNKTGPCKTLDDFKKVPGVPFKKIDDRRDRLVCF
jgi:competence protein ComEA